MEYLGNWAGEREILPRIINSQFLFSVLYFLMLNFWLLLVGIVFLAAL
jgi:hypothetical protein